jgi:hypothetical protein
MIRQIGVPRFLEFLCLLSLLVLWGPGAGFGQEAPVVSPGSSPSSSSAQQSFLAVADEVLEEMSKLISLPPRESLKKSLRSREEIRDYVLRQMKEEKSAEERYASQKTAEKFGLLAKGFQLEPFLVELLTEQIAGLYDPKAHEFYIADWTPAADQRMVMAHELTHALEDQHFHIESWLKAARPNDDAELARDAVLEGSAMLAMLDYLLRGTGRSVWELPEVDPELLMGSAKSSPQFSKAPRFIRDVLLFPYVGGLNFTKTALRDDGWSGLQKLFDAPPVSTQQILHPELYAKGVRPAEMPLPELGKMLTKEWKKLDENTLGEFGLREVLQELLGAERAAALAPSWRGDRYALFEHAKTKQLLLVFRVRLETPEVAAKFFGQYSEALEKKYEQRRELFRRPNYFSFQSDEGGVFLRCVESECVTVEGSNGRVFGELTKALAWPPGPAQPSKPEVQPEKTAAASPRCSNCCSKSRRLCSPDSTDPVRKAGRKTVFRAVFPLAAAIPTGSRTGTCGYGTVPCEG